MLDKPASTVLNSIPKANLMMGKMENSSNVAMANLAGLMVLALKDIGLMGSPFQSVSLKLPRTNKSSKVCGKLIKHQD